MQKLGKVALGAVAVLVACGSNGNSTPSLGDQRDAGADNGTDAGKSDTGGLSDSGSGGDNTASFPTQATYKSVALPAAPINLALDAADNVWVTVSGDGGNAVVKVSPAGVVLGTYPLDTYSSPNGIAIDASGNLWVGGGVTPGPADFDNPGSPYCCANDPHESLMQLNASGATQQNVLLVANGAMPSGNIGSSTLVALDAQGNVWVADQAIDMGGKNRNSIFQVSGGAVSATVALGDHLAAGLAVDATGVLWASDHGTELLKITGGAIAGTFDLGGNLNQVALDAKGKVWVAGGAEALATAVDSSGKVVTKCPVPPGESGGYPWGLAIDAAGHVWISNTDLQGPVAECDADGKLVGNYSSELFTGALGDIAIDRQGNVWVANYNNSLVQIVKAAHGPQYFPFSGPVDPL